jgi:23S rRNA (cytidine1920-2'-O)/16S rRNA (cytidine1409-2'-O)-methyltransferase
MASPTPAAQAGAAPPGTETPRRRLDIELVRRGLTASREQAAAAVLARRVLVSGAAADKVSRLVGPGEPIELLGPGPRFVSRGGEKLDAALEHFGVDVAGCSTLDVGSSTGGFVDCLLQRGAARVVAVDVGHGQLDPRLRADPRVEVRERTHAADLSPDLLGGPVDLVTADLSFISLRTVSVPLVRFVRSGGLLVLLVKPQFEAGRRVASRGRGVIRQPEEWRAALEGVASSLRQAGAGIIGAMVSPLTGPAGNTEFFLYATAAGVGRALDDATMIGEAVHAAVVRAAR